jgi:hypothetical protein
VFQRVCERCQKKSYYIFIRNTADFVIRFNWFITNAINWLFLYIVISPYASWNNVKSQEYICNIIMVQSAIWLGRFMNVVGIAERTQHAGKQSDGELTTQQIELPVTELWSTDTRCDSNCGRNACRQYVQFFLPEDIITHSLTHGTEPFFRSRELCSYSRISQYCLQPEGS